VKQKVTTIVAILLILIFVNVNIVGCTPEQFSTQYIQYILDETTELSIKTAYVNYWVGQAEENGKTTNITISDVNIKNFYCVYNGSAVVEIYGDVWANIAVIGYVQVADKTFIYGGLKITVYNSGQRYDLSEAYEKGLLSKENINDIYEKHKHFYPDLYQNYMYQPPIKID